MNYIPPEERAVEITAGAGQDALQVKIARNKRVGRWAMFAPVLALLVCLVLFIISGVVFGVLTGDPSPTTSSEVSATLPEGSSAIKLIINYSLGFITMLSILAFVPCLIIGLVYYNKKD